MSAAVLWLGIVAFAGALAVGVYLYVRIGWPVLAFALLGGAAAVFYVAPPIRWAYRGLGETVIGLSYGPWMVLGSLYLQARVASWAALWASLVPGLLIMALAVVNAIPDFHQDRLVGKRNLVVRLGRRRAVWLYLGLAAAGLAVIAAGVMAGTFPWPCLAALLAAPLLVASARRAIHTFESPRASCRPFAASSPATCSPCRCLPRGSGSMPGTSAPSAYRIDGLRAPLLVAWQITRDCDLACVHCCTGSAPENACRTSSTRRSRCAWRRSSSAARFRMSCCAAASRS